MVFYITKLTYGFLYFIFCIKLYPYNLVVNATEGIVLEGRVTETIREQASM